MIGQPCLLGLGGGSVAWAKDPRPSLHKLLSYWDQPPFPQSPSDLHACLLLPGHQHPLWPH